jgi:hypothetical protein
MKPRRMPSDNVLFSFTEWKSWDKEKIRRRPGRETNEEDIVGF